MLAASSLIGQCSPCTMDSVANALQAEQARGVQVQRLVEELGHSEDVQRIRQERLAFM